MHFKQFKYNNMILLLSSFNTFVTYLALFFILAAQLHQFMLNTQDCMSMMMKKSPEFLDYPEKGEIFSD